MRSFHTSQNQLHSARRLRVAGALIGGLTVLALAPSAGATSRADQGPAPAKPVSVTPAPTRGLPRAPACRGITATAVVGFGEYFGGTASDDVIVVVGGLAEAWGGLGNDLICVWGDSYHTSIGRGGPGDDVIVTYSGTNLLVGDEGDDVLIANGGYHELDGGYGDDSLNLGGASHGDAWGGPDEDFITGSPGDDELFGNAGADFIHGWGGADTLWGDEGNDTLYGDGGFDGLGGGVGTDACTDVDSVTDGATYGECEDVIVTPAAPGGFAFG